MTDEQLGRVWICSHDECKGLWEWMKDDELCFMKEM